MHPAHNDLSANDHLWTKLNLLCQSLLLRRQVLARLTCSKVLAIQQAVAVKAEPEIWDAESDVDSETSDHDSVNSDVHTTNNIHYVLSYFLLFFQLCYHVSDRELQHIIS